jgi:hypothetical protein
LYVPPRYLKPEVLSSEYIDHMFEYFFPQKKGVAMSDIILRNDDIE